MAGSGSAASAMASVAAVVSEEELVSTREFIENALDLKLKVRRVQHLVCSYS